MLRKEGLSPSRPSLVLSAPQRADESNKIEAGIRAAQQEELEARIVQSQGGLSPAQVAEAATRALAKRKFEELDFGSSKSLALDPELVEADSLDVTQSAPVVTLKPGFRA